MADIVDARVRVRVGESVFHTTKATLIESQLFDSLFALPPPPDNEYFIDGDPELFTHILRYLRTKTFPLFYDRSSGHDHCLYTTVLYQAEFYQVQTLVAWLSEKKYLQAVRRMQKPFAHTFVGPGQMANMHAYWARDEELTITSVQTSIKRRIKCPAGIWEHDGNTKGICALERCLTKSNSASRSLEAVNMPCTEIEGILTRVVVHADRLRREPVDSSGIVAAAMERPPAYSAGDDAPLPTVGTTVSAGSGSAAGLMVRGNQLGSGTGLLTSRRSSLDGSSGGQ